MIIARLNLTWKVLWKIMPIFLIYTIFGTYIATTSFYIWGESGMVITGFLSLGLTIVFFSNLSSAIKDKRKRILDEENNE